MAALTADAEWTQEDVSRGSAVTHELVGKYLSYLCAIGFLQLLNSTYSQTRDFDDFYPWFDCELAELAANLGFRQILVSTSLSFLVNCSNLLRGE